MKVNFNTLNFKGYSNLIYDDAIKNGKRCTLLSMNLDNKGFDENGVRYNDLDKYREFRGMHYMPKREAEDDVLTIFFDKDYEKKTSTLYVSDEPLLWGGELKTLPEKYPEEDYKIAEKAHMKIYTLLSSILKRIMESPYIYADGNYERVKIVTRNILFAITKDFWAAEKFVSNATEVPNANADIIAEFLNRRIIKTMERFFK